jgi:hypothetical protein
LGPIIARLEPALPPAADPWLRDSPTGIWFGSQTQTLFNLLLVSRRFYTLITTNVFIDGRSVRNTLMELQMEKFDLFLQVAKLPGTENEKDLDSCLASAAACSILLPQAKGD